LLAECADGHGHAIALRTLANALRRQGHLTRPIALFKEALAGYEASGDTVGRWQAMRFIGQAYLDRGDHEAARLVLEEVATAAGELGDGRLIAQTRYWIGQTCLAMGDVDGAQAAFDAVFEVVGDDAGLGRAYAMHGMGEVAQRRGAYLVAESCFAEAVTLAHDKADAVLEGRVWLSAAELRRVQGQADEQATALERAVAAFAGCGAAYLEARALAGLAQVMTERGDPSGAQAARVRIQDLYDAGAVPAGDRVAGSGGNSR
jgi:tetratricopeptide (TPR) repeat protein